MLDFYRTRGGQMFCDKTMPDLARNLGRIAAVMEKQQLKMSQKTKTVLQEAIDFIVADVETWGHDEQTCDCPRCIWLVRALELLDALPEGK